jgi:hypothetical protein
MVGVAGFEPATPASRTYRPDPYSSQFQTLSTTADDWAGGVFAPFEAPAFNLRAKVCSPVGAIATIAGPRHVATQRRHRFDEGER